jgi:hypothetical protein
MKQLTKWLPLNSLFHLKVKVDAFLHLQLIFFGITIGGFQMSHVLAKTLHDMIHNYQKAAPKLVNHDVKQTEIKPANVLEKPV